MTEVTDDQQQQRRQEEAFRCKYEGCNVWLDSTAAYEAHYNQYVVHTWRGGGGGGWWGGLPFLFHFRHG